MLFQHDHYRKRLVLSTFGPVVEDLAVLYVYAAQLIRHGLYKLLNGILAGTLDCIIAQKLS